MLRKGVLALVSAMAFGGSITQTVLADGACCLSNDNCIVVSEENCNAIPESGWAGSGTDCNDFDGIGVADVCETRGPKVYWVNDVFIRRADLTGEHVEDVIEDCCAIRSFSIDRAGNKVYWANHGRIKRASLNGLNVEEVVTGLVNVRGLVLDLPGKALYWSDSTGQTANILRAGLEIPHGESAATRSDIERLDVVAAAASLFLAFPSTSCRHTLKDGNRDGNIDLRDYADWQACFDGP